MESDLGEITPGIQRHRRVEGKVISVLLQFVERLALPADKKYRYFERCRVRVPRQHAGPRRVTLEYPHSPADDVKQQPERPMENAAAPGDPENRHGIQIACGLQHEAAGLEIVADDEVSLGPPHAGIL
jgi:hypothetical protein